MVRTATLAAGMTAGVALAAGPAVLWAAPLPQATGPSLTVSPTAAAPGGSVRVAATGFGGTPQVGATACIGLLGPGQNLELGVSPNFRVRLGTLTVGAGGTGTADVRVPVSAAAGTYRVTLGGCPPQPGLAPLAWVAEASLTVTRSGPTGLPATGGGASGMGAGTELPRAALAVLLAAGGILAAGRTRRISRHRQPGRPGSRFTATM
jgi:hypothetical protein